jgi:hypothetical protein
MWKCPSCGFDNDAGVRECQGGCGYEAIPGKLTLVAVATGREISISITTSFGKDLLRAFAGEDAVYASNPQFLIKKDHTAGGWFLEHAATAKNPTFVNGTSAAAGRCKLESDTCVTLGPEKMRLTVRFP